MWRSHVLGETMDNWSVLFVKTGSEKKVMRLLNNVLYDKDYKIFIPTKLEAFRRKGKVKYYTKFFFPGYVFFQFESSVIKFIEDVYPIIKSINEAYRFLSYSDKYDILMRNQEKMALKKLLGVNFCVKNSIGYIDKNNLKISSGSLFGFENMIKKINRHERKAVIELSFLGDMVEVAVPLEIIKKS
jgi:transcriptional antiterminator NusG